MKAIAIWLALCGLIGVGSSGCTHGDSDSKPAAGDVRPDFVLTFSPNGCDVSRPGLKEHRPMPCSQVVGHLTTTLGLQRGALFDVKTIPDVDVREYERVMHGLEQAGFRMTPGIHVGFLTAPKHKHPSPAE